MSLKSLSIVAAAALALCAGAAQAATTNGFANGGFEIDGAPDTPAKNWLGAAAGYTRSTDAHTGSFSAQLAGPPINAAVMLQNTEKDGGMPPLMAGDTPSFSFWTKGSVGDSGNVLFALRFLNTNGNILADSGLQFFNPTRVWTQITFQPVAVPVGATAAFLEFSQAGGGVGNGSVLIDDVYLGVAAIPEPSTYALMLAGLAGVGLLAKRRRQA
jgi:hypothetical protein